MHIYVFNIKAYLHLLQIIPFLFDRLKFSISQPTWACVANERHPRATRKSHGLSLSSSIPRNPTLEISPQNPPLHKTDLSRPFLVHSPEYRRPCLSLLCLLHQQHQTTRCSSYDRQPYPFVSQKLYDSPHALFCSRAVGLNANSRLVGTRG